MEPLHPKTILVALDTSPRATRVLATAVELAQHLGGKLVLVHAVGLPLEIPPEALIADPAMLPRLLEGRAKLDLEARAVTVPAGLVARTLVLDGTPWDGICRAARDERADLIVLGSHGYSGLDHLLGTTASRVVNHAKCSVLVVREPLPEGSPSPAE